MNEGLCFGIVSPLGSYRNCAVSYLISALLKFGYKEGEIRIVDPLKEGFEAAKREVGAKTKYKKLLSLAPEFEKLNLTQKILLGSFIRAHFPIKPAKDVPEHSYLARMAVRRVKKGNKGIYIFDQLKHPHEAIYLRRWAKKNGRRFFLLAVHGSEKRRNENLQVLHKLPPLCAQILMNVDSSEDDDWGQKVSQLFEVADLYISDTVCECSIQRFVGLICGRRQSTPTWEEHGMYLAWSTGLSSGDLNRQVGASIFSSRRDLIAVGRNDVPRAGGGTYFPGEDDMRDGRLGFEPNTALKFKAKEASVGEGMQARRSIQEVLEAALREENAIENVANTIPSLSSRLNLLPTDEKLRRDSIEWGRSVHAEMDAITAVSRGCGNTSDSTLFTTTFPCHNCARHIVAAGVKTVYYIEPYLKSQAKLLHWDSIAFDDDRHTSYENKVHFKPFLGVAPRIYASLFSTRDEFGDQIERKDDRGQVGLSAKK